MPSGHFMAIDLEAAAFWGGDGPPTLPLQALEVPGEATNEDDLALVDMLISGPDAEEVGLILDRSYHPRYLFDVPLDAAPATATRIASIAKEHGLTASAKPLTDRVSHRQRVELQATTGDPSKGFEFHGYWTGLASGLPKASEFAVTARVRQGTGEFDGRLQEVVIDVDPLARPIVRSELRGHVSSDSGRLMLSGADVLGGWVHHESLDGKADVTIRGLAAAYMARRVGAPAADTNASSFGWKDLPIGEALQRATELEAMRRDRQWEATIDLRPHSHREMALAPIREGAPGATVIVDGSPVCVLDTTWGDGLFDVFVDLTLEEAVARIRIVLATPSVLRASRIDDSTNPKVTGLAVISRRAYEEGVSLLYRERPHTPEDSGWRVFRGEEESRFLDDTANVRLVSLTRLVEMEPKLKGLLDAPEGAAYEKVDGEFVSAERD